jgi:hypothetical protein
MNWLKRKEYNLVNYHLRGCLNLGGGLCSDPPLRSPPLYIREGKQGGSIAIAIHKSPQPAKSVQKDIVFAVSLIILITVRLNFKI